MRIAILTDTHWSARKASRHLHDYFELFYKNIFFPALEEHGIETVIHMGDAFDNRKSIDFWGLDWTRRVVLDPLSKYNVHMVVGNHDIFLRNSTEINAPELLLKDYPNIKTYSSPQTVKIGGIDIMMVPWICSENYDETLKQIKKSKAKVAMGHLELQGFRVNRNLLMEEHGTDPKIFDKFTKVFSGHYHTRSDNGKIFYLGNTYEMYWNDVNDTRGFHIFDTETLEHTPINNPYKLFYNIYYEDTPHQVFDATEYANKIVKVIVRKKSKPKDFEKFIDKLYTVGIQDLKIIENFEIQENEEFEISEDENTLTILNRYIEESEFQFDKNVIKGIFQDLYRQACEVE
ncbi:SbcD-like subunit of palindrome specific endonuclease [Synechococcus phage S-SRM01]|uniref:Recombinase n=1 Tax=Synechococcus phage S-SRM01 TaxID=2781608 RepID=A0A879R2G9_9CAUD|nr:SbcD-like subunit of palindrome specific endonuclease [Synechococcus phage S-SRM01]QPX48191.1 recombinase [Synechococcus phage S-SRM01]